MSEGRLSADGKALEVTILGREFRIACPPGQEQELLDAVTYVDNKMRDIRDGAKVMGAERVAIMAALNIAHEHLTSRGCATTAVATVQSPAVPYGSESLEPMR